MRDDVIKIISSAKDITNAVVLTHNIDFVFVQTVALAAFRRCGHPTITIFADAACAAESFAHQAPALTSLGIRYRVVPVAMEPGFRFHPKAVLLSGEAAATLLVGSGNLTFGGWRENAEVWLRFDTEKDGLAPFRAFRRYLEGIVGRVPLPDAVAAEVAEAFDLKSKSWVSTESADADGLVGRVGAGVPLLDRMLEAAGDEPVDELLICTPYFDDEGVALQGLIAKVQANQISVLCQPEHTTLTQQAWEPSSRKARLQRVNFTRVATSGEQRSAFMHAKFYAFRRESEVVVIAGSANCSRAALTVGGTAGNAELQAVQALTPAEFEEQYLSELALIAEPIALCDEPPTDPNEGVSHGAGLRILAARFEARSLLVAYAPSEVTIAACVIDDATSSFTTVERGVLRAPCTTEPRSVVVRARVDGEMVESAPAWIDHERHLRVTARGRNLADTIRARIQPGEWNVSGWAEVLDVFCKHLTYMPVQRTRGIASRNEGEKSDSEDTEFTAADVFSPNYRAPSLGSLKVPELLAGSGRVQSLQQLMLRWYSVETEETEQEHVSTPTDEEDVEAETDDVVDRPEILQVTPPPKEPPNQEVTERDRRRIEKLLGQLETAMTDTKFLEERGPDYLAADLKVASALLRLGLREDWIERDKFFNLTQRIWSSLFFSSSVQKDIGWLEHRARTAEDKAGFIEGMRSAELAAALIGWRLAIPDDEGSLEGARFALAAVLAVARLPWLWDGGEPDEVANELGVLLSHTLEPGRNREEVMKAAEAEWALLLRRGHALRRLEIAVSNMTPSEIRKRIPCDELRIGDLLWQGEAGFCVVRHRASRSADDRVTALRLQGDGDESIFKASYTVPMRALLDESVVPWSNEFADEPRQVLLEFITELSRGFSR